MPWARDNIQKANRFPEHLEAIFQPNKEQGKDVLEYNAIQENVDVKL